MEANPDDTLMRGQKVEDLGGGRPVFAAQTGHDGLAQFEDGEDDLLVPGKKSGKKSSKIRNKIVKKSRKESIEIFGDYLTWTRPRELRFRP